MGAITSRQNAGVEEVDVVSNHAYKYPPRSGNYFGSHFIMGGERFDTPQPESYLFGENSDLNFLGCRPTPFPYPPPQPSEPTKTLKCLVNIRKESLRFVRAPVDYSKPPANKNKRDSDVEHAKVAFNIEFTFDCDVKCAITIYYLCTEEFTTNGVSYVARDPKLVSETFHYKKGANQQFCQMTHVFDPSRFSEDELVFDVDKDVIPVAIHCVAEVGPEDMRQSHTTIATAEKVSEGVYLLKALKQKLFVDGLCYLLQEIYGIENKNNEKQAAGDDDTEDNGSECVICMCDIRDTLILPCRHLCLCNSCADSLRYQSNNCPICRAPFRALLQIRALQKSTTSNLAPINSTDPNCENIPAGYEAISLIEALNGPFIPRHPPSAMPDLVETPDNEHAIQAAQILNRSTDKSTKGKGSQPTTPEYETSQGDSKEVIKHPLLTDKTDIHSRTKQYRSRDIIKHVNEKSQDDTMDEDSDAEKLSPLLQNKTKKNPSNSISMKEIKHSKDDSAEVIPEKQKTLREDREEESDYYTPEEATPNSAPLYDSNAPTSSVESTPQKLPGTPMSHASARSSGDSYSSGSSTRHLLSVISTNGASNDKAVHI